jgi:hypothetical protein
MMDVEAADLGYIVAVGSPFYFCGEVKHRFLYIHQENRPLHNLTPPHPGHPEEIRAS